MPPLPTVCSWDRALQPYPEAVEALARPMLGHLDPAFVDILDETRARLRSRLPHLQRHDAADIRDRFGGMEAAFVNVVERGDPVVIGVNGVFGARMCDVAPAAARRSCGSTCPGPTGRA